MSNAKSLLRVTRSLSCTSSRTSSRTSLRTLPRMLSRTPFPSLVAAVSIALGLGLACPAEALPPGELPGSRWFDTETRADANYLDMFVTNMGSFAFDQGRSAPGLFFPRGSIRTPVFAAGLWVGALVDGQPRVTVAEYSTEYGPGPMLSDSEWADPNDPRYQVYKIAVGDTPESNPDYAGWPVSDGAPVDENGAPRHLGHQTLWAVYNDLDPLRHNNDAGNSQPLGIDVQQTAFALELPGLASQAIFLEWRIQNKGVEQLESTRISLWCDPDLGNAADDLVGCDPASDLGFCYNALEFDSGYGVTPPCVGIQLVQGPIVPSPGDFALVSGQLIPDFRNLPMTAFSKYINGTDPGSPWNSWNYMQGLDPDGNPVIDPTTGEATTFAVSGDPVTGTGWVDAEPSDRRMMISAGPFDMAPGDVQVIAAVIVVGQGPDHLSSITALKQQVPDLPALFQSIYAGEMGACCLEDGSCSVTRAADCAGYFAPGDVCDGDACAVVTGACCFENGTCLVTTSDECGGTFQGAHAVCSPGLCPEFGPRAACCLEDGSCQLLNETLCLAAGGVYEAGGTCVIPRPGDPSGWRLNLDDGLMLDEIAGSGGVPVGPDDLGGPGNAVWHSGNSTNRWLLSTSGTGTISRFTRNGADELNLSDSDLILRWGYDPNNVGWWLYDGNEAAPIPFGLYEHDNVTGEERRLIVVLASGAFTPGIFDMAYATSDPWSGYPGTDWIYAHRFAGTYDDFLFDASDGQIDNVGVLREELFGRLIFASYNSHLPQNGTVIQFSTKKSGLTIGSAFDAVVPLSWPALTGPIPCGAPPIYDVYRDGVLRGSTTRPDFLDGSGVVNGERHSYQVKTRNSQTDETSEFSVPADAIPRAGGYVAALRRSVIAPVIDGNLAPNEWAWATLLDASPPGFGPTAAVRLMNDASFLHLAVEDDMSASDVRIHLDVSGNGAYEDLEGMVVVDQGVISFVQLEGRYPDVHVVQVIPYPSWIVAAGSTNVVELRIELNDGPLQFRPTSDEVHLFVHSDDGVGRYPYGPASVLTEAPALFARIGLAPAEGPPAIGILPPLEPRPGSEVVIRAQVDAVALIASVLLSYRVGGSPWNDLVMTSDGPAIFAGRIPGEAVASGELSVKVTARDIEGRIGESEVLTIQIPSASAVPDASSDLPVVSALSVQNPVRDRAEIFYRLEASQRVSVTVLDVMGRVVRVLQNTQPTPAGLHTIVWDCRDDQGRMLPTGTYFCHVEGRELRLTRRVTILR